MWNSGSVSRMKCGSGEVFTVLSCRRWSGIVVGYLYCVDVWQVVEWWQQGPMCITWSQSMVLRTCLARTFASAHMNSLRSRTPNTASAWRKPHLIGSRWCPALETSRPPQPLLKDLRRVPSTVGLSSCSHLPPLT